MAKQDTFLQIAVDQKARDRQQQEILPLPVSAVVLPASEVVFPIEACQKEKLFHEELSYEERKEQFARDLQALRAQYRPFMEDHLAALETGTIKQEFKEFLFRYLEEGDIFTSRNRSTARWESVTIPDYRGPAAEEGKWKAYYKTAFRVDADLLNGANGAPFVPSKKDDHRTGDARWLAEHRVHQKRIYLNFESVDYIARIYVNGCFVGEHEGFFAPFMFDITEYVHAGEENELIIEVENDISILGVGNILDGDKIYAATGPGWDDPYTGWHHCPAGGGILGTVTLEYRPEVSITDIFVRSDIDHKTAEVRVGVRNDSGYVLQDYAMAFQIAPKNFDGSPIVIHNEPIYYIGRGANEYRFNVSLKEFRLWEPDTPWLYGADARLIQINSNLADAQSENSASGCPDAASESADCMISALRETVGFKKFISDEEQKEEQTSRKGRFYFNNRPIVLRGANEMGHLQQCVMQGDYDQLVDDILIAKLCNMNYYRVTQRPVQRKIYDYFDMLGMMHQCDLPLFAFLRRPQFAEAVKQCGEMEHLIRSHVSTIMVTFINESMAIRDSGNPKDSMTKRMKTKAHRNLFRDELEAFFKAGRQAVYLENPDRVVKNAEGDYDPPTVEGMPDFHCYTMWYSNHAMPIGKLMAGYLPAIREGWMAGCGEYGAEGLDPADLMRRRYPREWLALSADGNWYPDKIDRAQTHSLHGDWYPEQQTLEDWARESQIYQAVATKCMTDAYRRRADILQQTAIHLLIDAWPSGWMKTLVDCERVPKRAYFAYADSLEPVRVNLFCPQHAVYEGETVTVEVWLLNDTGEDRKVRIFAGDGTKNHFMEAVAPAATSVCAGRILYPVTRSGNLYAAIQAADKEEGGNWINGEYIPFQVFPRCVKSQENGAAVISSVTRENAAEVEKQVERLTQEGKSVVLLLGEDPDVKLNIGGETIGVRPCSPVFFAVTNEPEKNPLFMVYNRKTGYIDFTARYVLETTLQGEMLAYTYKKNGFDKSQGAKPRLPFVLDCPVNHGRVRLISLETDGRLGCNPGLDALIWMAE